ncbi:methyltransferase domain-containing protein [Aquimarina agarivorans]|uniref:methyltransferase domain-containing protein n=1 Tax=Aquimarina agarivorans TaxID=980584 RepID=UPI000248EC48|nr:methyltransferase domain-containing protein [Aquimarina agarivorans]
MEKTNNQEYWTQRYKENRTGWDVGYPTTPLKNYIDQLKDKSLSILIPGAGNAYEAEYLCNKGFNDVTILDVSEVPLRAFSKRNPDFPKARLVHADFFEYEGTYDLIIEQTFFCSFPPTDKNRIAYSKKMHELLTTQGKLVGVWFDIPLTGNMENRPFGGDKQTYLGFLSPHFKVHTFDRCFNSIPARSGKELFGIFEKLPLK